MVENIKKNVITIQLVKLIMKCIYNEYKNLRYLHLMINGVLQVISKVNQVIENYDFGLLPNFVF